MPDGATRDVSKGKNGMTKVPYNPKMGNRASVNNSNTFVGFNSVVNTMNNYDGIGVRVNGKLIAFELDHCIEDSKLGSLEDTCAVQCQGKSRLLRLGIY